MNAVLRNVYVSGIRKLRLAAGSVGLLRWLERREHVSMRWLRSLFAIHDIDDLVYLDLPWWTTRAVGRIEMHLAARPNARVFEWGAGASTIWLAKRAASVTSIEHDPAWADRVRVKAGDMENINLHVVEPAMSGKATSSRSGFEYLFFDEYVAAIESTSGNFDLIVIDGRAREACLERAISRLAPDGLILLDDFHRIRYRTAVAGSNLAAERLNGFRICLPLIGSSVLLRY